MSSPQPPEFDDLVGADVPPAERERLRRAHDLMLRSDAPPELSPELEKVPWPDDALATLGLRRREPQRSRPWLALVAAAGIGALIGFFAGQSGGTSNSLDVVRTISMHGTALAPDAQASIAIGRRGSDGNWQMLVTVTKLRPLPGGGYYDLWLTRQRKPVALCGTFNVKPADLTAVRLSAAYSLANFDGWVVTRHVRGQPEADKRDVFLTTWTPARGAAWGGASKTPS